MPRRLRTKDVASVRTEHGAGSSDPTRQRAGATGRSDLRDLDDIRHEQEQSRRRRRRTQDGGSVRHARDNGREDFRRGVHLPIAEPSPVAGAEIGVRHEVSSASETRDSIADVWGPRLPHTGDWPVRVDERTIQTPQKWVQSACVLCSNGCALDIGVRDGRIVGVRGRAVDRINKGRLGPKGLHGWIANHSADRLTKPLIRKRGRLVETTWGKAMKLIVSRAQHTLKKYTAGAMAIYNTGQLFLEEYYTLALLAECGIGTSHVDGNTRLCTATAAISLIESFGTDGDPGSYSDFDVTDAVLLVGHNMAETQTVLWARILDRRAAGDLPRLVVVDPRRTPTAKHADVHLAPRIGTNVALLNGIIHLLIKHDQIDHEFIRDHSVGFDRLERATSRWTPERTSDVTGVNQHDLERAADIIGTAPRLVTTCLQGVYQSHQATAAACQVNNINIIRGMIGKPGCTVFQMNGQPSAQNTRECGCNGELTAFRNWNNPEHIKDQARIWNVEPQRIPHWAPPTHAMQIFHHVEAGDIRWLWVIGTNPAVSLPQLQRIRNVLGGRNLFLIVQDAFMTETAELADVVLPAAIWGEKTGTFTNADRTVHMSDKAIDPPGEARSDLDIFLDFARRMDFRDKDGQPLIKWNDAEGAFEAWKICSKGRPCDYSGLSYRLLREGSGIQWPCNAEHPQGRERLYTDGVFNTSYEYCETFGHDLETGAEVTREEYRANDPAGRAIIKAAEYRPPAETPDDEYPFMLTTGRNVYHFHTRTKTGRSRHLHEAAPDPWVELSQADAEALEVRTGDMVRIESRRGSMVATVRIADIPSGCAFVPFHYGYWDQQSSRRHDRAANELTISGWDPVSKQPHFKFAAVRIDPVC